MRIEKDSDAETSSARAQPLDRDVTALDALVFDVDGVLTRTAELHEAAWKAAFDEALERYASTSPPDRPIDFVPFTHADYLRDVDGRPRRDGITTFFAARGIALPEEAIDAIAEAKNVRYLALLREDDGESGTRAPLAYAEVPALLARARRRGLRLAAVSSSRNCVEVLERSGLAPFFDVVVDGNTIAARGLAGKPAPDMFLEAAHRLRVPPGRAAVFEDAEAGVRAGARAGFAEIIGVARQSGPVETRALAAAGAASVVDRLDRVLDRAVSPALAAALGDALDSPDPPAPMHTLPHALEERARLAARIGARPIAVFLDYDGTLSPIVPRPEDARLSAPMRDAIVELARVAPLAVVSGRDLEDVRRRVAVPGIFYAGSHGFDIDAGTHGRLQNDEAERARGALDAAERDLAQALADVRGVQLERKRFSLATHVRNAPPESVPRVERALDAVREAHAGLRVSRGKKVYELQPDIAWDKGRCVQWLLTKLGLEGTACPVFVGDDVTDEDAFEALRDDGLGIVVEGENARPSRAHFRVCDVAEVEALLHMLSALARRASEDPRRGAVTNHPRGGAP